MIDIKTLKYVYLYNPNSLGKNRTQRLLIESLTTFEGYIICKVHNHGILTFKTMKCRRDSELYFLNSKDLMNYIKQTLAESEQSSNREILDLKARIANLEKNKTFDFTELIEWVKQEKEEKCVNYNKN